MALAATSIRSLIPVALCKIRSQRSTHSGLEVSPLSDEIDTQILFWSSPCHAMQTIFLLLASAGLLTIALSFNLIGLVQLVNGCVYIAIKRLGD